MALRFKSEAEFAQWAQQHGKVVGGSNAAPITAPATTLSLSPEMRRMLGRIVWWFIGFIVGVTFK